MMIVQPGRFANPSCAIDPYAANRTFFLRGQGANGATPSTDDLGTNALTWGGNAQISTAVSLWPSYGSSLSLDGTNSYISVPDNVFEFGVGGAPFSLRMRIRVPTPPNPYYFILNHSAGNSQWGPGGEQCSLYITSSGTTTWQFWTGSGVASIFGSVGICDNVTHEVEMTYDGTTTRMIVDGALTGTPSTAAYADVAGTTTRIGSAVSGSSWLYGNIVDVTAWNAAVHTAAYTPATLPPC